MIKYLIFGCFAFVLSYAAFSQQKSSENPFTKLRFLNSPTDTVTLNASFTGIVDSLNLKNRSILATIKKNTGKSAKHFTYSIELKLDGYDQKLTIPCADNGMLNTLKSTAPNTPISIKCMVYHFYFIDGVCNFFYIDNLHVTKSI